MPIPAYSRRRFLRMLGQGALVGATAGSLWAADSPVVTISILHTTDLHGHILPTTDYNDNPDLGGLARCASQIRQWQRANPNSVLIDIGDVYQGTELGLRTRGATMIRCLNAMAYEAWVVGNHDFDWGLGALADAVQLSAMPVLAGNGMLEGRAVGKIGDAGGPLARMRPYILKEIAGIRLAILSVTTPALATWLPPEDRGGFELLDPVEALRGILREVAVEKPDVIVLAGHMGLTRRDDYANRMGALTREFPELAVCIGGHTHQNHSSETVNRVLYTQADHYGIYVGKVDLTFDRGSRRLLSRVAETVLMDKRTPLDPLVLSVAQAELDAADQLLAQPIGTLTETFKVASSFGRPSDVERLIGSAMRAALRKKGVEVDAVVHGLFDTKDALAAGAKTVADAWSVLPYENEIVTIEITRADFLALAREFAASRDVRNIMGVGVICKGDGAALQVVDLRSLDGSPLPDKPAYRIALNSYDAQSGGQRFLLTAKLVEQATSRRVLHAMQIRDALIDFFLTRQTVSRASLLV